MSKINPDRPTDEKLAIQYNCECENLQDEDYWDDDDIEDDSQVIGYQCMSCGHVQVEKNHYQCYRCAGPLTEL